MSHLAYYNYEGTGVEEQKEYWMSQVVRIGDIVECSGQGGWDRQTSKIDTNVVAQIEQTFDNIDHLLKLAGSKGWGDVFSLRCYSLPLNNEAMQTLSDCLKTWCPDHRPIVTGVGVARLAFDDMRIEIEVRAHAPLEKKE